MLVAPGGQILEALLVFLGGEAVTGHWAGPAGRSRAPVAMTHPFLESLRGNSCLLLLLSNRGLSVCSLKLPNFCLLLSERGL